MKNVQNLGLSAILLIGICVLTGCEIGPFPISLPLADSNFKVNPLDPRVQILSLLGSDTTFILPNVTMCDFPSKQKIDEMIQTQLGGFSNIVKVSRIVIGSITLTATGDGSFSALHKVINDPAASLNYFNPLTPEVTPDTGILLAATVDDGTAYTNTLTLSGVGVNLYELSNYIDTAKQCPEIIVKLAGKGSDIVKVPSFSSNVQLLVYAILFGT